jgi:hypothetical protein
MGPGRIHRVGTDDTARCGAPPSIRLASRRSARSPRSRRPSSLDNSGTRRGVSVRSPPGTRARTRPERAASREGLRCRRFSRRRGREAANHAADVARETVERRIVGLATSSDRHVARRFGPERRKQPGSRQFSKPPLEAVAIDRGVVVSWHDDPNPRMRQRGREHADIEVRGANSLPLLNDCLNVEASGEPSLARKSEAVRRRRICSAA